MNKSLRYLAILALIPLFTTGMDSNYFVEVDAAKSQGSNALGRVGVNSYGSANAGVVCGDVLCKDYPGGRAGWEEDKKSSSTVSQSPKTTESSTQKTDESVETTDVTEKDLGSVLRLSRANVPATIPMHQGYYDGGDVFYIITDSSDPTHAEVITANQGWQVELAFLLKNAPDVALSKTYMFTNGVKGDGIHGFQGEVFTSTPAQADVYSALTAHVHVTWNDDSTPRILNSQTMVMEAADNGEITLTEVDVVLNMPQIV